MSGLAAILRRDLKLAARRRTEALLPLGFFFIAAGLFPLGVGPEPQMLRAMAPGVVWVCALLAAMLAVTQMFASDLADGSLEQMLLGSEPLIALVVGKVVAQWITGALPLVVAAPVIGLMFGLPGDAIGVLVASLVLGTPILSLLGAVGAALTLGLRSGAALLFLLVLPLATPALIFGAGAVAAVETGLSPAPHLSLLGALLIASALGAPPATAAALRIALE